MKRHSAKRVHYKAAVESFREIDPLLGHSANNDSSFAYLTIFIFLCVYEHA